MKIIISPAKKLNTDLNVLNSEMSFSFLKESTELISELKKFTVTQVKDLMNLSVNLANINWNRFQSWGIDNLNTCHPIFMFQGDVYKSMRADDFSDKELEFAQENLRILSGLYGLLKPLDKILPYRLEMGTKFNNSKGKDLYTFWGDKIYDKLYSDLTQDEVLINLASNEYSRASRLNKLSNPIITPIFKDYKNGKLKTISFFAKRARGEMCSYIIRNQIVKVDDLKLFNNKGYSFESEHNGEILFIR
tara:strand:- start:828 stop:1571 length:744 start_codon:yes stop_codon:yes gene_type:complete